MKKTIPLDPMQATGLLSLAQNVRSAERLLEETLSGLAKSMGAKIVGYQLNPPSVVIEVPDEPAAVDAHAHEEIKA